jgi:carbon storage regulator
MLVLQRKAGESICIGSDIEIVVLNVAGGKARLGFRCPPEVPIRRSELQNLAPDMQSANGALGIDRLNNRTA